MTQTSVPAHKLSVPLGRAEVVIMPVSAVRGYAPSRAPSQTERLPKIEGRGAEAAAA